jgi:hypothetical protein
MPNSEQIQRIKRLQQEERVRNLRASEMNNKPREKIGQGEALLRGSFQGGSMGFGEEGYAKAKSMLGGGEYEQIRDEERRRNAMASDEGRRIGRKIRR